MNVLWHDLRQLCIVCLHSSARKRRVLAALYFGDGRNMSVLVRFNRFYTPFMNYIEITESGYYKGLKYRTFL